MSRLELISIHKAYDRNIVLRDLNITFESGQVTAILGDNGAGKSTLLKILSGMVHPSEGKILYKDCDISSSSVNERRRVGIEAVYQDYALFKHHSGLVNLFSQRERLSSFGFLNNRIMKARAKELFEELNLDSNLLEITPAEMSGGQQQAVAIARAVLFSPAVILLDEPTAALGAREVKKSLELIQRLKMAGKTIILVSHRFQDVFEVSDRIIVLKNGAVASDRAVQTTSIEQVVNEIVT